MADTKHKYSDIINLPHPVSTKRPQMPLADRAAQFSPFAAVVGHEAAVKEAARYTEAKRELDEMEKALINEQLKEIESEVENGVGIEIVYFRVDARKTGGAYVRKTGRVKKINSYERHVLMSDGLKIKIDDILKVTIEKRLY